MTKEVDYHALYLQALEDRDRYKTILSDVVEILSEGIPDEEDTSASKEPSEALEDALRYLLAHSVARPSSILSQNKVLSESNRQLLDSLTRFREYVICSYNEIIMPASVEASILIDLQIQAHLKLLEQNKNKEHKP